MAEITELAYAPVDWHEELPAGHTHKDVADVCVDPEDRVYLFARWDSEVLVYERDGRFVRSFGRIFTTYVSRTRPTARSTRPTTKITPCANSARRASCS